MPETKIPQRMLFSDHCGSPMYWTDKHFVKDGMTCCSICEKPLFIEHEGDIYPIGEKMLGDVFSDQTR